MAIDFNEGKVVGMKNLFACLGVEFTACVQDFFKQEDQLRLYKCQKRASEVQNKKRKYKAREKVAAEETVIVEEGPTYGQGKELKH